MHLGKNILAIIIISRFFYSSSIAMGSWHIQSAEMEKPRPSLETPKVETKKNVLNPLSLKILSALTLVKNKSWIPPFIPLELREYVQFIKENFIANGSGLCIHGPTINNAIRSNMYEIIPDLAQILRSHDSIHALNVANLPKERTPLVFAIEKEDIQLAHELLECGANPNTPWPTTTETPLILAVKLGNIPLVELLIQHHADIEQTNRINGNTPLMEAVVWDKEAIVRILLKNGAKKNVKGKNGYCAAMLAGYYGHKALYKLVVTPEHLAMVAEVRKCLGLS